ncbi:hypothetical protein BpHYR1_021012 [Brachionus plicatilis]|uniref:Uncharacterized protein n=1 Tax=Brachionus plicatilis TaxID=10195 RepID=A0A3M7T0K8_BRAPC|nr:hypothetical protein BpHYR1_021012 [Brachionus plicatilis]
MCKMFKIINQHRWSIENYSFIHKYCLYEIWLIEFFKNKIENELPIKCLIDFTARNNFLPLNFQNHYKEI